MSRSEPWSHQVVRHCGESFDQVGFDSPEMKLGLRGARVKLSVQPQGLPSSEVSSQARLDSESVDGAGSFSLFAFWLSAASHMSTDNGGIVVRLVAAGANLPGCVL
jgi:hypothetical protein